LCFVGLGSLRRDGGQNGTAPTLAASDGSLSRKTHALSALLSKVPEIRINGASSEFLNFDEAVFVGKFGSFERRARRGSFRR
jgi:hypothetical protein